MLQVQPARAYLQHLPLLQPILDAHTLTVLLSTHSAAVLVVFHYTCHTHAAAPVSPPPLLTAPKHPHSHQNLIEKITRNKIYSSVYWKKDCFGLSAEALVDKAVELKYVGGMMGEPQKPSEFICLILKMLQIQPDKEIIIEFIKNDDYKYVRLLGEHLMD